MKSVGKNTAWNLLGSVSPMLLGLVTIPYLIDRAGVEIFGILTLVWALIGYFSIFDFGVGRALTHQVSTHRLRSHASEIATVVKSGLLLLAGFGMAGGVLLAVLAYPLAFHWLGVSEPLKPGAATALLIAAFGIPMTTLATGLRGVLEGYEEFRAANLLRVLLGCANFGFPALGVMVFGPSLEWMVASLVLARLLTLAAHWPAVHTRLSGWKGSRWRDKASTDRLLSFGAWMTLSNVISPLMVNADRFVIASLLGASVVAYYTVPFEVVVRMLLVPAALTAALFPRFSSLFVDDREALRRLYRKAFWVVAAVMLPLCVVLATGAHAGLSLWLSREFADQAWLVAGILCVGLLFNALAQIPHAAIQAAGDVRTTALVHVGEFILYVPALVVAIHLFGLVGAASVWTLRVFADLVTLTALAVGRMR